MSETTTAAVNTAAKKAGVAASAVSDALPTVIETAELALEVPVKVVLNQKLVVAVSMVGGAALGAGILFGINKWRNRNKIEIQIPNHVDDEDETNNDSAV